MNKKFKTQSELEKDIETKIEKTAFRNCYQRWDPEIDFIVIVHRFCHMVSVVASCVEGAPESGDLKQYLGTPVLEFIPSIRRLMDDCNNPASPDHAMAIKTKAALETMMNLEVRAFYCPPGFFVQFTGNVWE